MGKPRSTQPKLQRLAVGLGVSSLVVGGILAVPISAGAATVPQTMVLEGDGSNSTGNVFLAHSTSSGSATATPIPNTADNTLNTGVALSPDGSEVAFVAPAPPAVMKVCDAVAPEVLALPSPLDRN